MKELESYNKREEIRETEDQDVKRATFQLLGPFDKLYNIVVHICNSAGRTQEFKDLAKRIIPLDNRTQ